MTSPRDDPGLADERTCLARDRTSLSAMAAGLLMTQHLIRHDQVVLIAALAVGVLATAGVGLSRLGRTRDARPHGGSLLLLAVTLTATGVVSTLGAIRAL